MKILISILAAFSALSLNAQMLTGRITYETEMKSYYPDDNNYVDTSASSSNYTIDFNERYIRTFIGMDELMTDYISFQDKITGKTYFASLNEELKTVHFINLDYEVPEVTDGYYDGEYEEEKPDLDNYHENFYLDLLQMPLNDTIVISTDETKEILGFNCKKYIMKTHGQVITIWTTEQVKGMEQSYNLPKPITGLVLELYLKDKNQSVHTTATFFSTQTTLTTEGIEFMPDDYRLDLGVIYLETSGTDSFESTPTLDIPNFIEAPEYVQVMASIKKEIENATTSLVKREGGSVFVDFLIQIDEKGKIVSITPEETHDELVAIDVNKMSKAVKKKCSFKNGFQLNGTPVKSSLTISYSRSSYNVFYGY